MFEYETREGNLNAPTVFNAAYNIAQFWDGRVATLEEQIDGPMLSSVEMGGSWNEIVAQLATVREYVAPFEQIYAGKIDQ